MTEQELLEQLAEVDLDWQFAKKKLVDARKPLIEIEDEIIELKIKKDSLTEKLRVFKATDKVQPLSIKELEIQRFRKENPEVCAWARERDSKLGKK